MQMIVGYKFLEIATGAEVQTWGGAWGQCPDMPNPLRLPNDGHHVHAPELNVDYGGYQLVAWIMDEPPAAAAPPTSSQQVKTMLMQLGMTADQADSFLAAAAKL